jgi:hypothetical protein
LKSWIRPWYGVPGDDGTREEGISIYISICIVQRPHTDTDTEHYVI